MSIVFRYSAVSAALLIASVEAADQQKITAGVAQSSFSADYGSRRIFNAEYLNETGPNTFVVNVARGQRDYDNAANDSFRGQSFSATYYRNWSDLFSSRSSVTASSNSPVFVRRVFDQDVTYKGIERTTLTAGAKHSDYYGGVNANAWYLGGAYYFDRVTTRARYTHYHLSGVGSGYGVSLMAQLKDGGGGGATQLWLGKGTSVQEYNWSPVTHFGDFHSVALRRVQPLSPSLSLAVSLEKAWYDTSVADYHGVTGQLSVSYKWD